MSELVIRRQYSVSFDQTSATFEFCPWLKLHFEMDRQMKNSAGFFEAIGVVVIAAVICIAASEIVVRLFFKPTIDADITIKKAMTDAELCRDTTDPYDRLGLCYNLLDGVAKMNFSTYFGYVPAPGVQGRGYQTNRASMRHHDEVGEQKDKGEYRVFVTGGSTAWGAGVPQELLYTKVAEDLLKSQLQSMGSKTGMRMLSAGVGGYVSTHEVLRYLYYVRPLKPDLWVMFTGWNDVYAGYRGRDYVASPDMLDLRSAISTVAAGDEILRERLVTGSAPKLRPPAWRSYNIKLLWLFNTAIYNLTLKQAAGGAAVGEGGFDKARLAPDAVADLFMTNVSLAATLAKQDGIKLVVMLQPTIYSTAKRLSAYEQGIVDSNTSSYPDLGAYYQACYPKLRERLRDAASRQEIVFIDSDHAIEAESRSLFVDHVHFGDRGNAAIGNFLAGSVRSLVPVN